MLTHQDPSMALGSVHRHDISVIRDNEYQNERTQRELDELETSKTRQCLKKTAKFLFSHIGLVTLVGVYATAGGFLFELLERHQEKLNCQEAQGQMNVEMNTLKQKIVAYIQYNTSSSSALTLPTATYVTAKDNTTVAYAKIAAMLYDFRDFVISTSSNYRYSNDDCSVINKWTYPNSLLFAITIITTIGYGNIT
jgi:transcriptional/translational regulatory protein YebC/TACO1